MSPLSSSYPLLHSQTTVYCVLFVSTQNCRSFKGQVETEVFDTSVIVRARSPCPASNGVQFIPELNAVFHDHPVLTSFVPRFDDDYLRGRHIGIEFHVCGHHIAWSDHLQALGVGADIQRVSIPLSCVQDKAQKALVARNCASCCGRNILDVQLPVDEVDLWIGVEGLLDVEWRILY